MSEMVERVAMAHVAFLQKKDPETLPWEHADEDMRDAMRELARETIAAMREPTKAMIEVMMYFDLERACHCEDNCTHYLWENEAPILWRAAIDEALK